MKKYIIALDQGTTSSRAMVFDHEGTIVASAQKELTQFYPRPGYVEQDPLEIYASQSGVLAEVMAKGDLSPEEIAGIGISNQRETTILWEKDTGRPVYNAIVWQCRRTAEICEELKAAGHEDYIRENTGLLIDAYFSGTKIKWILDHVPGLQERAEKGEILFGTVDSWLIWKMTGGAGPCHRLHQCLPHDALQHPHPLLGSAYPGHSGDPGLHASGGPQLQRNIWDCQPQRCSGAHRRCGRRPAGCAVRADLL